MIMIMLGRLPPIRRETCLISFHMATFTKKELKTQINKTDTRIALLKLHEVTIEEGGRVDAELQKLNAARSELLEKMKVATE